MDGMIGVGITPAEYRDLPIGVRVLLAIQALVGWRYGRSVSFPALRPGLPATLVERNAVNARIDCSSAVGYVVITATPKGRWNRARYDDLQIMDADRPFSPIEACEAAGVGSRVDAPVAGLWHGLQTWRDSSTDDGDGLEGGHLVLAYATPDDPDLLRVFESTTRGPGDGWGPTWSWRRWSDLVARYPDGNVRAVALGPG